MRVYHYEGIALVPIVIMWRIGLVMASGDIYIYLYNIEVRGYPYGNMFSCVRWNLGWRWEESSSAAVAAAGGGAKNIKYKVCKS